MTGRKPTVLFICGSMNQTTQLHAVARELHGATARFTPYYVDGVLEPARRWGWLDRTIAGNAHRRSCAEYFVEHGLASDFDGKKGPYDLVVTCTDLFVPANVRGSPIVVVQEGMLDPEGTLFELVRKFPVLPRWLAGTALTGQSGAYRRFCVASEGYRDHFVARGAPADRVVVTGIPNFDDCDRYRNNDYSRRHYVLVCTSDARETLKRDDRAAFIRRAVRIAAGRPMVFKLHPNEDHERARREIARWAPRAVVHASGRAEEMIANADVVVCQYSSLAFVALALGKELYSYFDPDELRRLLPVQNRSAAKNIAAVCRAVLEEGGVRLPSSELRGQPGWESAA
jgi:hypothetical protein